MQIEMRTQLSGTRDGVDWPPPGGTIDLPDDEAAQLIADGAAVAVPVTDEPAKRKR